MRNIYPFLPKRQKMTKLMKNVTLGFALLFGGYNSIDAQVSSYTFSQTNGTYTPITGTVAIAATGNTTSTNLNSEVELINLPFNFSFNGINYSSLNASSNGFVTFGSTPPTTTTLTPISGTVAYDGAISAFGRDLTSVFDFNGVTGNISWEVIGTAPNREMVIQWKDFRSTNVSTTTTVYTFSFQIRLSETTNVIKTVYNSGSYLAGTTVYASTAQIGLRGSSNADYNNRLNAATVPFVGSASGTANSSTQAYSTSSTSVQGMPTTGLTYTWTPPSCFAPPSVSSTPNITLNSIELMLSPSGVLPANGYEIYYDTNSAAVPTSSTTPNISNVTTATRVISGLASSTSYYIWVRSVCSSTERSAWSQMITAKTLCAPVTNMIENFDSYATGNIVPDCWDRIIGASNTAQTISSTSPVSSGNRHILQTATSPANATIVVLPSFSNVNAGTHWLRLKARVASGVGSLDVGYVTDATGASSFTNIQTLSIANTTYVASDSEYTIVIPSTIPANARLAIRNSGTAAMAHFWDDVNWEPKPTCVSPANIYLGTVNSNSATVSWSAVSPAPANGYDIYYSTSSTPPTTTTTPTITGNAATTINLANLSPLTQYYVWIRSQCSTSDSSTWKQQFVNFTTICQPSVLNSVSGANFCAGQAATLSAVAEPGAIINWYTSASGGNPVGTGTSFTTPALTSTTNYWAAATSGSTNHVGPVNPSSLIAGATTSASTTYYVEFEVTNIPVTLMEVDVFPDTIGDMSSLQIVQGTTTVLHTIPFTTTIASNGTTAQTVPVNITLMPGTYRLRLTSGDFWRNYQSNATFPYTVPNFSITSSSNAATNSYYFIYNMKVSTGCESPRQQVTATLDSACLGTSEATKKNEIKVYPNPFHDVISISDIANVKSLSVMDISGRVVRTIENVSANSINLSELKEGMYILQLHYKDGSTSSQKVIKK